MSRFPHHSWDTTWVLPMSLAFAPTLLLTLFLSLVVSHGVVGAGLRLGLRDSAPSNEDVCAYVDGQEYYFYFNIPIGDDTYVYGDIYFPLGTCSTHHLFIRTPPGLNLCSR